MQGGSTIPLGRHVAVGYLRVYGHAGLVSNKQANIHVVLDSR